MRRVALLIGLLTCTSAEAEPIFTGRVSLTGMYYTEADGGDELASRASLGYADLRGLLEGKRLWKDRLDLRLDLRLRLTANFDYESKFDNRQEPLGTSARGYLGGQEYDLREAYARMRLTDLYTLQVGRMFVREADILKIDGALLSRRFGPHWEGSVFLGGYPNPYSRSILSDYTPPCGAGVASAEDTDGDGLPEIGPCQTGPRLGLAAGLAARYDYSALWGAVSLVGSVFAGPGDGGPVVVETDAAILAARSATLGEQANLRPAGGGLDAPRIYVSWINSFRPIERLDLFADLVVDLYGSAGPQVTRLVTLSTLRLLRDDRLTLRLGYTHMSSLAIDLYLNRLLYNRLLGSTLTEQGVGFMQTNLTAARTARDEVRATADVKIVRRLGAYLDGRFRHRALIDNDHPTLYESPLYTTNTARLGFELAAGLRDSGTLFGVRAALSYIALFNFRGSSDVLSLDLGRDFWGERLTVDIQYVMALTRDNGAAQAEARCDPRNGFTAQCFGLRSGSTHELGLALTANPWRKLFLMADYRFIALLTNPIAGAAVSTVLSHSILARGEYRW